MKVAIYARVSTDEQSTDVQLEELKAFCKAQGHEIVKVYADDGYTGRNTKRPNLIALRYALKSKAFDAILVWKLDRLARSLKELITLIEEFEAHGIKLISLKDRLDLGSSEGRLMMHILGAFAQFESDLISARVTAGIRHAMKKGAKFGAKRSVVRDDNEIKALRASGLSYQKIADKLKLSWSLVYETCNP